MVLMPSSEHILKIFEQAKNKISIRSINFIYSYLSYENMQHLENYVNVLNKGVVESQANDLR